MKLAKILRAFGALCFVVLLAEAGSAQLININFAPLAYSGSDSSPATPSGSAGIWNTLTNNTQDATDSWESVSASVLYSDGSAGPALSFDEGRAGNWGSSNSLAAANFAGGVYDVPNLYEDGVRTGNGSTFGWRVRGLAAGDYQVSFVPFFDSYEDGIMTDLDANITIGVDAAEDPDTGDQSITTVETSQYVNVDTALTEWQAGNQSDQSQTYNYIGASITITDPSEWLTFLVDNVDPNLTGRRGGVSAVQILAGEIQPPGDGDFDTDGDVDGNDFLVWQRNPSVGNLADWQASYGSPLTATIASVPEPSTVLISLALLSLVSPRVKRRG